jgi:hypothetical protein
MQYVQASVGHMGTGFVMHHDDTPCELAGTLSPDGSTKVLEGPQKCCVLMMLSGLTTLGTEALSDAHWSFLDGI